jgi:hypothetical protein
MLISGVIALPLVFIAVLPFVLLTAEGGIGNRSVYSVINGSASLSDFILPSTDHFLWGSWVGTNFPRQHWMEGTLYIGLVSGSLSALAWIGWWRGGEKRKLLWILTMTAAISFIIALGTHLHWMEQIVRLDLPAPLNQWLGRDSLGIRLPGFYLYQIIPMFSKIRVFKRFAILGLTCASALAGLGAYWLFQRVQRRYNNYLAALIIGLAILDFYPGPFDQFSKVEARPVDFWLAEQPNDGAVVQFPFDQIQDQDQIYNTLIHGKPFVGGFFNAFPPRQYLQIKPTLDQFPDRNSVDILERLGVHYVIINFSFYEEDDLELIQIIESLGLKYQGTFDGESVFILEEHS